MPGVVGVFEQGKQQPLLDSSHLGPELMTPSFHYVFFNLTELSVSPAIQPENLAMAS